MTEDPHQDPSTVKKVIISSSNLISKLENLKLLQNDADESNTTTQFPKEFPDEPVPAYEIFGGLEKMILSTDEDDEDSLVSNIDELSHLVIISQSVLSYIKTISPGYRLVKLSNLIYSQISNWVSSVFFSNSVVTFLPSNIDSLSKVIRLALTSSFENYSKDGIQGIKPVSIYAKNSNPFIADLKFATHLVGLSQSCIKIMITEDKNEALNLTSLEKEIETDRASDVTPLLILADLGSSFCGAVDGSIAQLTELSEKHQIWLHLTGGLLTSLALHENQPENTKKISSMILDFEKWLGLPELPPVLLHKNINATKPDLFEMVNDTRKIEAFPLWTALQNLGRSRLIDVFNQAFQSCRILHEMIAKTRGFTILSRKPEIGAPGNENSKDYENITVVVFQFDGSNIEANAADESGNTETVKAFEKINNPSYFDRLNSWLGQNLERDFPAVQLTLTDHESFGTCIRYSPFELRTGDKVPSLEALTEFYEFFEAQSDILCATIQKKQIFNDLVEKSNLLRLVQLNDDWAGLGGVHYIPENMETIETDQGKTELNKLNTQLVQKLRSSDNAFSLGESKDGVACIRFGMVTSETDIEELLDLVINAGNALQESSKVLDSMAEVIRKGIQAVETDLRKEADEKVWNDGILRVVPVVGSVLNWIHPLPKDNGSGIRGRSLNLQQGVVESTENIYKYHMQWPMTSQEAEKAGGSGSHSRNESQSSTNSKSAVQVPVSEEADVKAST